jgi:hypothetical protein
MPPDDMRDSRTETYVDCEGARYESSQRGPKQAQRACRLRRAETCGPNALPERAGLSAQGCSFSIGYRADPTW